MNKKTTEKENAKKKEEIRKMRCRVIGIEKEKKNMICCSSHSRISR